MAGMEDVARRAGLRQEFVQQVFEAILILLGEDNAVVIRNFGSFVPFQADERVFRSPQLPGGQATVEARRIFRFRSSPAARAVLNGHIGRAKGTPVRPKKLREGAATRRAQPIRRKD